MGIRTTVTLDEDVLERVKQVSRTTGVPLRQTLNNLLRTALSATDQPTKRVFTVTPSPGGLRQDLSYDDIQGLFDLLDGPEHR